MKNKVERHKRLAVKPGITDMDGFMGTDKRPPAEIIRADDETARKNGFTHKAVAERMAFFQEAGKEGLGEIVAVKPHFEVSCEIARGLLPCPFGEPGLHRKTIVMVRNTRIRKEIIFSDLNIHLIAAHGFYEGKGSPFRLEPDALAEILEAGV
ncbi:MAG: hypothetical protein PHP98_08255 [Kiritimatiellae bacterium]|nr:hypothetical protein [Kiritimatiellia bacterium]